LLQCFVKSGYTHGNKLHKSKLSHDIQLFYDQECIYEVRSGCVNFPILLCSPSRHYHEALWHMLGEAHCIRPMWKWRYSSMHC